MSESWNELASRLTAVLSLDAPPIAITFSDEPPSGIAPFADRMPAPTPDGRTGRVAAGCVFWVKSIDRTFTTVAEDHQNCSVGSLTHGFIDLSAAATRGDVAALVASGWVTPDVFPQIPVVAGRTSVVTYGPLAASTFEPDVVLVRLNGAALMLMASAVPGMSIEGKPQCHIVAIAKEQHRVAASVGCALSRARTGMPAAEMACAIPADQLATLVQSLESTRAIDESVARYARQDAQRFADQPQR
jgi:uncharacterized protein (DUF169 family)